MNEHTEITNPESDQSAASRESDYTLRPPVNIFEDSQGITLEADLPGVSKERLQLKVDKDSLLIEGEVQLSMTEAMEALYADVRATRYSRSFSLSRELDVERIDASLRDGVLRLRIPKRAEIQPRKIEVQVS